MKDTGYSIGEAANASGVTVKAIRHYEEIGIIPRAPRSSSGGQGPGHRIFSADDVGRLRFIHHARALGLGLSEIRDLTAIAEERGCPGSRTEYREILTRHLDALNEQIDRLAWLRAALENLLDGDRPAAEGGCTWETCGCMTDVKSEGPLPKGSDSHSKKGENHV